MRKPLILCVCGARPNFMNIVPIVDALERDGRAETLLVHTGQHYDQKMSRSFFHELGIRKPDVNLDVGSNTHAVQTADVMTRLEPICIERSPSWVVVVGDVNSTVAAALVAAKLGIKIAHVEAGLRSFDRSMPEEINRLVTDALSDLLFVTEPAGVENLRREGIADGKVHLIGNVMIDTLLRNRERAEQSNVVNALRLKTRPYSVLTLHRPSNVDAADMLLGILSALEQICAELPIVMPAHPRTTHCLERLGLLSRVRQITGFRMIGPLGYLDFVKLMADSALVLTDSGGIQEETTVLGVPCLTLRENTERPITLTHGTNTLAGTTTDAILAAYRAVRSDPPRVPEPPKLWDGKAAERAVARLLSTCG